MAKESRRTAGEGWALLRECPKCGRDERNCRCAVATAKPGGRPVVRLRMEKRRGKPVTVLACEGLAAPVLETLLKELKASCGAGGTLKESELELQGEHREKVRGLLAGRGYVVKG